MTPIVAKLPLDIPGLGACQLRIVTVSGLYGVLSRAEVYQPTPHGGLMRFATDFSEVIHRQKLLKPSVDDGFKAHQVALDCLEFIEDRAKEHYS